MNKLTLEKTMKDLQRKEFIQAMEETEYGWKASRSRRFSHVGCPNDLYFIHDTDLPHEKNCVVDCKECWNYVLKNKWGKK